MNNKSKFWQLQKTANLSNKQCAEYLGVNVRSIERWRLNTPSVKEAPKAAILALEGLIEKNKLIESRNLK